MHARRTSALERRAGNAEAKALGQREAPRVKRREDRAEKGPVARENRRCAPGIRGWIRLADRGQVPACDRRSHQSSSQTGRCEDERQAVGTATERRMASLRQGEGRTRLSAHLHVRAEYGRVFTVAPRHSRNVGAGLELPENSIRVRRSRKGIRSSAYLTR